MFVSDIQQGTLKNLVLKLISDKSLSALYILSFKYVTFYLKENSCVWLQTNRKYCELKRGKRKKVCDDRANY